MDFDNNEITIIIEYNCHEKRQKASVWLSPGLYDDNDDDMPSYTEIEKSIKLIGPIDNKEAEKLFRSLNEYFIKSGFNISKLETADD